MTEPADSGVAIYIDFDNIVISRYNAVHGRDRFSKDGVRHFTYARLEKDEPARSRLEAACVDLNAIIDYASSLGTVAISKAYADWSVEVNSRYQKQLLDRAVELVQLFPTSARSKNGADIRLAVDVIEDLFRLSQITDVVIVAGDTDYVPLAQRCRRLGRRVVGIGVATTTGQVLKAACDEFVSYEDLESLSLIAVAQASTGATAEGLPVGADNSLSEWEQALLPPRLDGEAGEPHDDSAVSSIDEAATQNEIEEVDEHRPILVAERQESGGAYSSSADLRAEKAGLLGNAYTLLTRSIRLVEAARSEEWVPASSVKYQMRRIDPSFNERSLGFQAFLAFVASVPKEVEILRDDGPPRLRLIR